MREQHRANAKSILRACVLLFSCGNAAAASTWSHVDAMCRRRMPGTHASCSAPRSVLVPAGSRIRQIVLSPTACDRLQMRDVSKSTDSNPSGAAYRVTATGTAHARSGPWPHTVTPDRPPARDRGERRVGRVGAHTCHLRPPAPLRGPHMCIPTHFRAVFRAHRGHRYLTA